MSSQRDKTRRLPPARAEAARAADAAQRVRPADLVRVFVGAAQENREAAPLVCREAAATFAGLALDPRNARISRQLQQTAMEFAAAARRPLDRPPPTVDDFEELLEETAEAYGQVGGHAMDVIARRRELHEERKPGGPHVSITPESFNTDLPLGRNLTVKFNPTEEEKAVGVIESGTVAFWQGFKHEAQAATVDVAMTLPPAFTGPGSSDVRSGRPYGIIEYGSDGNRTSAKFDVGLGTRFTVVGNYISVLVGMDPVPGNTLSSQPYVIGGSVGVFAAPSLAPVLLTEYADELANGATATFRRPLRAVQILNLVTSATAGASEIAFFGANGVGFIARLSIPSGTLALSPIPIPNDVGVITVTNNTGNSANYRLVFQLSL